LGRPYRPFYSDREEIFLVPPAAFKIWMYHYKCEGQETRESWPSIETLCEKCDLNESTVLKYRKWLLDNGWLVQTGYVNSRHGHFAVPKFRVRRGTVPEKIRDGREKNRPGRNQARTVPTESGSVAPEKIRTEVMSSLNQCHSEEVIGRNEGKKEASSTLTSFATKTVALESAPNQNPLPRKLDEQEAGDLGLDHAAYMAEEQAEDPNFFMVNPNEDPMTRGVWTAWIILTGISWSAADYHAAKHLIGVLGMDSVVQYLEWTRECPRTAKILWKDFAYWASSMGEVGLTKRSIDAWRRGLGAKSMAANAGKPQCLAKPNGHFTTGDKSVCCDCGAHGRNVANLPRCQECVDTFKLRVGERFEEEA
jgi:hypothetical protein